MDFNKIREYQQVLVANPADPSIRNQKREVINMFNLQNRRALACWNSTENPSERRRASILAGAHRLCKEIHKVFACGEIAIPSQDARETLTGVEICIMFHPLLYTIADMANWLSKKAEELNLPFRNFACQTQTVQESFTDEQMENLKALEKKVPDDVVMDEAFFEKVISQTDRLKNQAAKEPLGNLKGTPNSRYTEPLGFSRTKFQKFKGLSGKALENEIKDMLTKLDAAAKQPKTAWSTIMLIASGVIVGYKIITSLSAIWSFLTGAYAFVLAACAAGFGTVLAIIGIAIVAILAIVGAAAYMAFKGARNFLLVLNDTSEDIISNMEYIGNGEQTGIAPSIPARTEGLGTVWGGIYIYDKWAVGSTSLSFFGTVFGISFASKCGAFSVGMDCPNTIFGGRNSMAILDREHAYDAMVEARDHFNPNPEKALKGGWVRGLIADSLGNINWGRVIVEQTI